MIVTETEREALARRVEEALREAWCPPGGAIAVRWIEKANWIVSLVSGGAAAFSAGGYEDLGRAVAECARLSGRKVPRELRRILSEA